MWWTYVIDTCTWLTYLIKTCDEYVCDEHINFISKENK